MNILVLEKESTIRKEISSMIKAIMPNAGVISFKSANETIEYVNKNYDVDIAFINIDKNKPVGLRVVEKLKNCYQKINIVFCAGDSEYSLEAHELYCSAYLMKPITENKIKVALENLRFPISSMENGLRVKCFGDFEIYKDRNPIVFKNKKNKELFAYLIDRCGATVKCKIQGILEVDLKCGGKKAENVTIGAIFTY